jgi:hypothetical protein
MLTFLLKFSLQAIDDFTYSDSSKTQLLRYIGKTPNVTIPAQVKSITKYSFKNSAAMNVFF